MQKRFRIPMTVALVSSAAQACSMGGTANERNEWFVGVLFYAWGAMLVALGFALAGTVIAFRRRRWFGALLLPTVVLTSGGLWFPSFGSDCGYSTVWVVTWQIEVAALLTLAVCDSVPEGRWSLGSVVTLWAVVITSLVAQARWVFQQPSWELLAWQWKVALPLVAVTWGFVNGRLCDRKTLRDQAWAFRVSIAGERVAWLTVLLELVLSCLNTVGTANGSPAGTLMFLTTGP